MRVALCLSGHTRNYTYNYPNLVINPNNVTVDTFISTVWQSGLPDKNTPEYVSYHSQKYSNTTQIDIHDILKKYNPKLYQIYDDYNTIEQLVKFEKAKTKHNANLSHIGMMFYRIYNANQLKKQFEQRYNFEYDYVIRSRFDLKINDIQIDINKIHLFTDTVYTCDLFFAANSEYMNMICSIYTWFISQDVDTLQQFDNAEHILHYYIDSLNNNFSINNQFDISFTKDYPIQTVNIKNGNKQILYGY